MAGNDSDAVRRNAVLAIPVMPDAAGPDLLRAAQKDESTSNELHALAKDLVSSTAGAAVTQRWATEIRLASDIAYEGVAATGMRSIGEEYCDIIPVSGIPHTPLSLHTRLLHALLRTVFPYAVTRAQSGLLDASRARPSAAQAHGIARVLSPALARWIYDKLPQLRVLAETLQRAHLGWFYLFADYYRPSSRAARVRYVFARPKQSSDASAYTPLGIMLFAQLALSLLVALRGATVAVGGRSKAQKAFLPGSENNHDNDGEVEGMENSAAGSAQTPSSEPLPRCTLCLGDRVDPTATACGHIFCWMCIAEWTLSKPECPLCRQPCSSISLVRVYNYDGREFLEK